MLNIRRYSSKFNNVAYITLNRPEAANGINKELAEDLEQVALRMR